MKQVTKSNTLKSYVEVVLENPELVGMDVVADEYGMSLNDFYRVLRNAGYESKLVILQTERLEIYQMLKRQGILPLMEVA